MLFPGQSVVVHDDFKAATNGVVGTLYGKKDQVFVAGAYSQSS